jgi:hypothetical protein
MKTPFVDFLIVRHSYGHVGEVVAFICATDTSAKLCCRWAVWQALHNNNTDTLLMRGCDGLAGRADDGGMYSIACMPQPQQQVIVCMRAGRCPEGRWVVNVLCMLAPHPLTAMSQI